MLLTIALVVIFRAEYNPETFLFKQPINRKENILRKNYVQKMHFYKEFGSKQTDRI